MKKIVYIFAVLLLVSVKASAQNPQLIIDNCVAPIGGKVVVVVKYNTEGKNYSGVNFNIDLPTGLTYELDDKGNVAATMDASNSGFQAVTSKNGFAPFSTSDYLAGETGTLLTFVLNVASDLTKDQELTCNVRNIAFTSAEGKKISLDPFTFVVKISDRWVLDENSTVAPVAPDGPVNVLVKRSIVANQWSTICLPFDFTLDQAKAVFGDDVKFAYFRDYTIDGSAPNKKESVTTSDLQLNFCSDDLSYGTCNYPFLIKTSKDISEFTFDGVTLQPNEDAAVVKYDITVKVGRVDETVNAASFYGTLHAGEYVPENGLFLNNNRFFYSKGLTRIKGFRCYLKLKDLFSDVSSAKLEVNVDGEATSIDGLNVMFAPSGVYDLSGRKIQLQDGDLNKLQKGVYIIDGKKVTIK